MAKKSNVAFFWMLFVFGGVAAAFLLPVHVFLFGLAFPLGWIETPGYESLLGLLQSPVTRLYLLVLCVLSLFHAAHRFRYALYDGAQIRHLNEVILVGTYGGAFTGSIVAAYLLFLAV